MNKIENEKGLNMYEVTFKNKENFRRIDVLVVGKDFADAGNIIIEGYTMEKVEKYQSHKVIYLAPQAGNLIQEATLGINNRKND